MEMRKKILAGMLAAVLLMAACPIAYAAGPEHTLTREETAEILLHAAADYNPGVTKAALLKGYPDGTLGASRSATRIEGLIMLCRAFGDLPTPVGNNARLAYPAAFTDVPLWAEAELADALEAGIITGENEKTLAPDTPLTDKELEVLIHRVYALEGTDLKDDFYAAVNKIDLDASAIPLGHAADGAFFDLAEKVDGQVAELIREIAETGGKTAGEKRLAALYKNILNVEARNKAGIAPLTPYLNEIDTALTFDALMEAHSRVYEELGCALLLGFGLTVDAKDSAVCLLTFDTFAPILGQGYETSSDEAYVTYLETLFTLTGLDETEAAREAEVILAWDHKLAAASLPGQELSDVEKTYNIFTLSQLQEMFPAVDLTALFLQTGLRQTDRILVEDVGKLRAAAELFDGKGDDLDVLKCYARLGLLSQFGFALNEEFSQAQAAFNEAYLGVSGSTDQADAAAYYVQSIMGEELGKLYVERCFSAEAKANAEALVEDILKAYRNRIQRLDWMSQTTKEKALEKLETMKLQIAYPETWEEDEWPVPILTVGEGGSFFQNLAAMNRAYQARLSRLQETGPDKTAWIVPPYTVNAFYTPSANTITFPAAILQPPFYDETANFEENLGGIGYVIAHEITHAFDDNGAKFDEKGNAVDWWTAEDYAAFQEKCQKVLTLYDGKEFAPGITCDGELTLSENIADLGAIACLTELEGTREDPHYGALYTAVARTWCASYPRKMAEYRAKTDVHAPDKLRGSLVLQNFEEFYEAFGITKEDGMWLPPEERVVLW